MDQTEAERRLIEALEDKLHSANYVISGLRRMLEESQTAVEQSALTLRDQFAMAALPALIADERPRRTVCEATASAYRFADAMLEARKPRPADLPLTAHQSSLRES